MMIRTVLFDCGGVFVEIRFQALLEELLGGAEKARQFFEPLFADDSPWLLYDQGLYDSDAVYRKLLPRVAPEDREALRKFMLLWPHYLPTRPGMEHLVEQLHQHGVPCYLLSNFSHRFEEFLPLCPAIAEMDGMVISYRVKMRKPNPDIFLHTIKTFHLVPEETLFVDDTPVNIRAAAALGFATHLFQTPEKLRGALADWGLLPTGIFKENHA